MKAIVMKSLIIFLSLLFQCIISQSYPYHAFCHVPVANLFSFIPDEKHIGQPWDEHNLATIYPRLSQLLFNEVVLVNKEDKEYAYVTISHWFYIPHNDTKKVTEYWIKKDTLTPMYRLKPETKDYIPPALSYKTKELFCKDIATLKYPFKIGQNLYSAGTRFKIDTSSDKKNFTVKVYDQKTNTFSSVHIPACYLQIKKLQSHQEKRDLFVSLLKEWTSHIDSFYPYVLGGASLTYQHPLHEKIITKSFTIDNIHKQLFYRPLHHTSLPMGIDCSHLIVRAAHIAQIPLFARNTTTLLKTTTPLSRNSMPQNGDFLVSKGHCCIISDIDNQLLIEARGYGAGYGKVHEILLSETFKNVQTYKDLFKNYRKKEPLLRIDKEGKETQTITDFAIISLIQ